MKLLCTSDWHMGIYGDPSDALKLSNDQLLDLFDRWEAEYDLILLNGDILEVLKSARVKFSHFSQTRRILDDRKPVIERITGSKKYLWLAGNHDHTLEQILGLPLKVTVELEHGYTLIAEHGHLLRAPKEHYSTYAWHFHLMYCLSWWIDKLGMKLSGRHFCLDTSIAQIIEQWPNKGASQRWRDKVKDRLIKLAFSYASLNSDNGYTSLHGLFLKNAQLQFEQSHTLVTFGHSHCRKIEHFDHHNIYLNTGSFCAQNSYSTFAFSTDTGQLDIIKNI